MSLFAAEIDAIAARYGVPRRDVVPPPLQGEVNLTVFLGRDLVLRIPRSPKAETRLAKEAAVIPVVRAAGVSTPDVVAYDTDRVLVDVTYMLQERAHGPTLDELGYEPEVDVPDRTSLAEQLAVLHRLRLREHDSIAEVPEPARFDPEQLVRQLCDAGELGTAQGRWLLGWFDHLARRGALRSEDVLLHGDILPANLIVDRDGRVTTLIDWGCAEWGHAVRDFVDLPARALPGLLARYRSAVQAGEPGAGDGRQELSLEAGALWYHLFWALAKLRKQPSNSEGRNWSAPRHARLLELLRFTASPLPDPWPGLLPPPGGPAR